MNFVDALKTKAILSLIFGSFMALACLSQTQIGNLQVQYGQPLPNDSDLVGLIGEKGGWIYGLSMKGDNKFFIKAFESTTLGQLLSNPIKLPELQDKDVDFEDAFFVGDKLYAFGSVYVGKESTSYLVAAELDEKGNLSEDTKQIFQVPVRNRTERGTYYFRFTEDGSNMMAIHFTDNIKEHSVKCEVKLLDSDLNTVAHITEYFPYEDATDSLVEISDFFVTDDLEIYLLEHKRHYDKKDKVLIGTLSVHEYRAIEGFAKNTYTVEYKGRDIINAKLIVRESDLIQVVGLYGGVKKNGRPDDSLQGVFSSPIDPLAFQENTLNFHDFDLQTRIKLIGETRAAKGKDVKPLYTLHSYISREDGGIILISEYRTFKLGYGVGIGPVGVQGFNFDFNEMIITSLDEQGNLEWTNVLPKEQRQSITIPYVSFGLFGFNGNFSVGAGFSLPLSTLKDGGEYLSAVPLFKEGELIMLFNDDPSNRGVTDIDDIKRLLNAKEAMPTAFRFDSEGHVTRVDPADDQKSDAVLRPGVFLRISQSEYIIYGGSKGVNRLGRVTLK